MVIKEIGLIILLMGCLLSAYSQNVEFTDLQSLPEAKSALTSTNDGENIYVVNGFSTSEQFTPEVYKYNISIQT